MAPEQHHHRSTTKAAPKPFKSKHLSKGAVKEKLKGKVESLERGTRRTPHQQVLSRLQRRNQAKQRRLTKDAHRAEGNDVFRGKDGAARHVVVVPLSESISCSAAVANLLASIEVNDQVPTSGLMLVDSSRFKQKLQFRIPSTRDIGHTLELCKLADYVLLVMSAEEEVDELGEAVLRAIESQGISTVVSLAQDLGKSGPVKKQHQVQASLKSFINHFFATLDKVHSLDAPQECLNVVRSLCNTAPKGIKWRDERSWLPIEAMNWESNDTFSITGSVRGRNLKADRLVHIDGYGTFQIDRIVGAPLTNKKAKNGPTSMDTEDTLLEQPTEDADVLADLAPEEAVMEDVEDGSASIARSERKGVLLDDHHYFDDNDRNGPQVPKRLPRGTSKYQSAWYLGDVSDSGSDLEDVEDDDGDVSMNGQARPADGTEGLLNTVEPTEGAPTEYAQSEMFLDPSPDDEAEQLASYRANRRQDAEDDLEFPDEIELHPHVLARERLARYRGLKSLRTSAWDTEEDKIHEPQDWNRLLEIANYKAARNRFANEALVGGVAPGTRVEVFLRVGDKSPEHLKALPEPVGAFSLLRHEQKRTVMNYSITLPSDYPAPLKSKEPLVMQCGSRRLVVKPLYSQSGHTPNNVHKFDRFLHPGQTATATIVAPLTWGSVPVLFFKPSASGELEMLATGTSLPPSTSRVIAKRAILTGHPYKIHKRLVTIRYMFFNREDVEWFRALQLWTRRGRSGFVKEALGTHGYFKATFDGKINALDSIGVSLYKRMWPRWAEDYVPSAPEDEAMQV